MKRDSIEDVPVLSETEKKLLELLVTGVSSKSIAEQMGLKDGTTRVYLHSLYKRLGVNNKTSAVTWYLDSQRAAAVTPTKTSVSVETFGDRAVQVDLLSALGMMEVFLGPYGRMWDMLVHLEGQNVDSRDLTDVRLRARHLWSAFVRADFIQAAQYFDKYGMAKLFIESPSDAVVLSASLLFGGYTSRAEKALSSLKLKRGGSIGITVDEKVALTAIGDVANGKDLETAIAGLHRLADKAVQRPVFRHLLIVALFHAYKMRGDNEHAAKVGNLVWWEAEAARRHLENMGDLTFPSEAHLPAGPKVPKAEVAQYLASAIP